MYGAWTMLFWWFLHSDIPVQIKYQSWKIPITWTETIKSKVAVWLNRSTIFFSSKNARELYFRYILRREKQGSKVTQIQRTPYGKKCWAKQEIEAIKSMKRWLHVVTSAGSSQVLHHHQSNIHVSYVFTGRHFILWKNHFLRIVQIRDSRIKRVIFKIANLRTKQILSFTHVTESTIPDDAIAMLQIYHPSPRKKKGAGHRLSTTYMDRQRWQRLECPF